MSNEVIAFVAILAIGFVPLVLGLIGAEVHFDFDLGHGLDFIKPVPIGIGLVFAGSAGLIVELTPGVNTTTLAFVAAGGALIAGLCLGAALDKFMKKDGGNLNYSREFFQGKIGTVDMAIAPDSWGMVNMTSKSGALISQRARTEQDVALKVGEKVIVVNVDDDYLTVEKCPFE